MILNIRSKCQPHFLDPLLFILAPSRFETWVQLPNAKLSAIHFRLIVVSLLNRAAIRTFRLT